MIQPIPGKKRYQVLMDHACPGHFEFVADFDNMVDAGREASKVHAGYRLVDVVVLDAESGVLCMTLPGRKTLTYNSI